MMRVGFIGIGTLGWPLAETVVRAGHEVLVCDADRERAVRFAAEAGGAAADLAGIAACEFVVTVLPTSADVRSALLEADGRAFLAAVMPGTVAIDMTSGDPRQTRHTAAALKARGVAMIDAPVSKRTAAFGAAGGTLQAATSALPMVIMVGADDREALARARPLLEAMGDTLIETGPLGSGHAAKALNNYASAAAHVGLAEAMLVAERFGLDLGRLIEVINQSTGRSFASEVMVPKHLENADFRTGFTVGLMLKDVEIAAALAEEVRLDAPLTRLVRERWAEACRRLGPGGDVAEAVPAFDDDLPDESPLR